MDIFTFNQIMAMLTLLTQITVVLLLMLLLFRKRLSIQPVFAFISENALWLAFMFAVAGTVGSLLYSDIYHYEPCRLCWYGRIFLYPQVILLGIAAFRRDFKMLDYALALSIPGALIGAWHYLTQLGIVEESAACVAGAVSCAGQYVNAFGYISIPMMGLTAFIAIITIKIVGKYRNS